MSEEDEMAEIEMSPQTARKQSRKSNGSRSNGRNVNNVNRNVNNSQSNINEGSDYDESSEDEDENGGILGTAFGAADNAVIKFITQQEYEEEMANGDSEAILIFESGSPMSSTDSKIPPQAVTSLYSSNINCGIVTVLHRGLWMPDCNGAIIDTSVGDLPSKLLFHGDYSTLARPYLPVPREWGVKWLKATTKTQWDGAAENVMDWEPELIENYHNHLLASGVQGKTKEQHGKTTKRLFPLSMHYGPILLFLFDFYEQTAALRRIIRLIMKPGGIYDLLPVTVANNLRNIKEQPDAIKDVMNQIYCNHFQRVASIVANIKSGKIDYNTCTIKSNVKWTFIPNVLDPKSGRLQCCTNERKYV